MSLGFGIMNFWCFLFYCVCDWVEEVENFLKFLQSIWLRRVFDMLSVFHKKIQRRIRIA